jgi:hypothetical protein
LYDQPVASVYHAPLLVKEIHHHRHGDTPPAKSISSSSFLHFQLRPARALHEYTSQAAKSIACACTPTP